MKNNKLLILIGISGSGKTTWSTNYIKENSNWYRVNRDDIRKELVGDLKDYYKREDLEFLENKISDIQHNQIRELLLSGKNVILDNTNLKDKYINDYINKYNHLADIELKLFSVSLDGAKSRIFKRDGLSDEEMKYLIKQKLQYDNMYEKYVHINKLFPKIDLTYSNKSELPSCIICDLDGTLCLFEGSQYKRDFFKDVPNKHILSILLRFENETIIFISGRSSEYENETINWLDKYFDSYILLMRDYHDNRRDSIVKMDLFNKYIKDEYHVKFIIDDRLQVIEECWEKLNLPVLNCNYKNLKY